MKPEQIISNLNLNEKQSLVDLMFLVQGGTVSCRRAVSEIMRLVKDRMDSLGVHQCENCDQWTMDYNTDSRGEIVLCDKCSSGLNQTGEKEL